MKERLFVMLAILSLIIGMGKDAVYASENESYQTEYDSVLQYDLKDEAMKANAISVTGDDGKAREVSVRAFEVLENDEVMILDAQQEKILVFHNKDLIKEYDISFCIDPQFFIYENNTLIIFDLTSFGEMYYLNENGEISKIIELPEEIAPYTIAGFYNYEEENYLITYEKELISFPDFESKGILFNSTIREESYSICYEGTEWNLPCNDRQLFNPVYVDKEGCLYIEETTIAEGTEYIQGETYLLKLDKNNNEVMSMRLRLEEYENFPDQYYDFYNGDLYVLELFEKRCQVSKVRMSRGREESHIAEMEKCNKQKAIYESNKKSANAIVVSRTRKEVASQVYGIVQAGWTINKGNKTVIGDAILPKYIKETEVGKGVVGLPYCWGGYGHLSSILGNLVAGKMAGNVNTDIDAIDGPVGYDCSGFVSYCYGLGSHIITRDMIDKVALTEVDSKNMQSMDLVWKNGHVMLFSEYSGNYINVYESTTEGEQKTRAHSYTFNFIFTTKGYKSYTPW